VSEKSSNGPVEAATLIVAGTQQAVGERGTGAAALERASLFPGVELRDRRGSQHFEVLNLLGAGAMGEVHLARDVVLRRKVALKSLLPDMQQNPALLARFMGEMQITAQLDHPHIVPVYAVETGPEGVRYAMKLIEGRELEHLLQETRARLQDGKPLDGGHSLESRLEIFTKVCDAISYAHERGVIHRDIKPSNVMIGRFGEVYVMDWGIARRMGKPGASTDVEGEAGPMSERARTARTRVGSTVGTPIYMSPEQASGNNDDLDGASDQYALGLLLQEIVTLEQAMVGSSIQDVLEKARAGKRRPVVGPKGVRIPRELVAIIDRCTRLERSQRYPSVAMLAEDVRRFLRNEPVLAEPDTFLFGLGRWVAHNRMLVLGTLFSTFVFGAVALGGLWLYDRAEIAEKEVRELRLTELQSDGTTRVQALDEQFYAYEKLLTRFAGAAGISAAEGPRAETLFLSSDFDRRDEVLSLRESRFYGKPVSLEFPVTSLAPGVDRETTTLQGGGPLRTLRVVGKALVFSGLPSAESKLEALLNDGGPIVRVGIALESGLRAEYPGMKASTELADGRKEILYQRALSSGDVVWGPPEPHDGGAVHLHCATALRDLEGRAFGVASLEIDAGRPVNVALDTSGAEYVETSLLVERTGRVLAQRSTGDVGPESDVLSLAPVRQAIERGETGYLETTREGRPVLVTYQPLRSLDWYLVTIANIARIERSNPTPAAPPTAVVRSARPGAAPASRPTPTPTVTPVAATEPTASASASVSAVPVAAPPLSGRLPPKAPEPSAAPPTPNPFDRWKAYDKEKKSP
jgi:serine/threonine-protein kinase